MHLCSPRFWKSAINEVKKGRINVSLIDESVSHVLEAKFRLGLFEDPRWPDAEKARERTASPFSLGQAQKLAEESLVLVKNENQYLPLDRSKVKKVAIVGPNADNWRHQAVCTHDYNRSDIVTIVDAFKAVFPNGSVVYEKGCGIEHNEHGNATAALAAIESSDVAIVVIGDMSSFFAEKKSTGTLELQGEQLEFLGKVVALKKPFILNVLSSKPLVIPRAIRDNATAIMWQFCPGMHGGTAFLRIVLGEISPSGRLSISIPDNVGQHPVYYNQIRGQHGHDYVDIKRDPEWAFGYGLLYSNVTYENAKLDHESYLATDTIHVSVTVHNPGAFDVSEVIQVYISDLITSVTWADIELKGFKRVDLKNGERRTVDIAIPASECSIVNGDDVRVVEPGEFEARVGKSSNNILFKLPFTIG
jgi:beta-glucosidase